MKQILTSAVCFVLTATAATASSSDAWDEFRADVETKCLAAAGDQIENAAVWVDPFGTESYGVAIVRGKAKGASAEAQTPVFYVCVYDKQSEAVELTGENEADALK